MHTDPIFSPKRKCSNREKISREPSSLWVNYYHGRVRFICASRSVSAIRIRDQTREFSDGSCRVAGARYPLSLISRLSFVGLYYRFLNRIRYLRPRRRARGVRTYVMAPGNLVNPGIGLDVALEVNVDTLPNSARIQIAAKLEGNHRRV